MARPVRYIDVTDMSVDDAERALCEARGVEFRPDRKSILSWVVCILVALAWVSVVVMSLVMR